MATARSSLTSSSAGSAPVSFPLPANVRPRPGRAILASFGLLAASLALTGAFAAELSRFQRTVSSLQAAEPEVRGEFATAALTELLEIYLAESDLARSEAAADEENRKLYTWALAVDRYSGQLEAVLAHVEQGLPVAIRMTGTGGIAIRVDERQVMLTHPRRNQQSAYEQRVLMEFCGRNDCDGLTASRMPLRLPLYSDASAPQPSWVFTDDETVCSYDGIQVFFGSTRQLASLRAGCQAFFQEISDLLTEMTWQQLHGAAIEWDALAIRATPGQTEHFVTLNAPGDTVLASLPLLYANPDLLVQVAPWLRERSKGQDASLVLDGSRWELDGVVTVAR